MKQTERVGEVYKTRQGYDLEIIEYFNSKNCTVKFNNGIILYKKLYSDIKKGLIRFMNHPSVCGIGYLGYGKHKAYENKTLTKSYNVWHSMILRCYSSTYHIKYVSYQEIEVCEEWKCFQNFAEWFENNYIEGFHLDKDILIKNNKTYSPETCCFVPSEINKVFVRPINNTKVLPLGVEVHKKKYVAKIAKYGNGETIGYYNTIEETFNAYKEAKENHIKEVANMWKDRIDLRVYNAMCNYKIEITD